MDNRVFNCLIQVPCDLVKVRSNAKRSWQLLGFERLDLIFSIYSSTIYKRRILDVQLSTLTSECIGFSAPIRSKIDGLNNKMTSKLLD